MQISTLCTEKGPKNDLFFNCRTKSKHLSKKELSNVAPASKNDLFFNCGTKSKELSNVPPASPQVPPQKNLKMTMHRCSSPH